MRQRYEVPLELQGAWRNFTVPDYSWLTDIDPDGFTATAEQSTQTFTILDARERGTA